MFSPRFVCLDSSTWGRLAKDRERNPEAKRVVEFLNAGALIPYFTWHHVEEICQHGDDKIYDERVSLIESLRFVAFPKLAEEVANIGNVINLRHFEIIEVIRNPSSDIHELVDTVRPQITNGFCTGSEFCSANRPWWDLYRAHFAAERQTHKAQVASLVQFPMGDQKEKISDSLECLHLRSEADAKAQFAEMASSLAKRLRKDGDPRLGNPDEVAYEFMNKAYEDGRSLYEMEGNEFERLLQLNKVDRNRLPANATMEDLGRESHFRKLLELHESWLALPSGSLYPIVRQDMLPSWIVWSEVDRAMKNSRKADASNINDMSIISFALYVDALECDKRVREFVRQGAARHNAVKGMVVA